MSLEKKKFINLYNKGLPQILTKNLIADIETPFSSLLKISKMENQNTSLIKGYKGCFYFIKCKFTNNPVKKIKYFDKGKHLLERAINDDPKSVELKFLRYSIQKNLPKFLLYYENIEKDLNFVKKNITNLKDEKTRKFITTSLKAISK